jgi:hypothetical protein
MQTPVSRRRFLQTGSLLSLGLGLSEVARLRAVASDRSPAARPEALAFTSGQRAGTNVDAYSQGARRCPSYSPGGGLQMGQVIGSTDRLGEHPKDRPLSPNDVWATVYRHLGIDPEHTFPDLTGRPMPILPDGEPIKELL